MPSVVSFRPTKEEEDVIERTRRTLRSKSRTDAVRYLLAAGAKATRPLTDDPVWKARAPKEFWLKKSLTSREIDDELYGRKS